MPRLNALCVAITLGLTSPMVFAVGDDCIGPGCAESAAWAACGAPEWFDFYRSDLPREGDRLQADAILEAEQFDVSDQSVYRLRGNPSVLRLDQYLQADALDYLASENKVSASGNVRYQDRDFLFRADSANTAIKEKRTEVSGVSYQLLTARGNGEAKNAVMLGEGQSQLTQVSYSSCDPGQHTWEIAADEIALDQEQGVGRAKGMRLKLKDTTILYWPYASFPITDERKSGFLMPGLGGGGSNGIDFILPYYLNLAPDFDATLSPRLMSKRGLMLGGEFRFLGERQQGSIEFSYLPNDHEVDKDRGSFRFRDAVNFNSQFNFIADLNHVSDDRYFEDFGDSLTGVATSFLPSSAYLHGRGSWWTLAFGADATEVTDPRLPDSAEPYRRLPRLAFEVDHRMGEHMQLLASSEFVRFDKDDAITGSRLDLYPRIGFPFEHAAWFFRPQFGARYTGYQLDLPPSFAAANESPSHTTPIASLDTGWFFERPVDWFGSAYTQTLEPRLYYLYADADDQTDAPIFDTQELTFGFAQLFRDNRFTGADRQSDANQLTMALSTRLLDKADGQSRARLSLGRIQYFDAPTVQLPGVPSLDLSGSDYIGEVEVSLSDSWDAVLTHQYDPELSKTDFSAFRLQKRFGDRGVFNAGYRYRRDFLEQADLSAAIPLNANWRVVSRWNYSLFDNRTLEAFMGLEYDSCCTAFRILGRHYVRNVEGETNNGLYFELELKGLGTLGRRSEDLLRRAIRGYR